MTIKNVILLFATTLFFIACSSDEDPITDPTPDPDPVDPMDPTPDPDPVAQVLLDGTAGLGEILTDQDGRSLYFFSLDIDGNSACNGDCATNWPPYFIEDLLVEDGLNTADFTTVTRADGSSQTAYKGWPLYYFANDNGPSVANGEGANNVWYVAKPDYTIMVANGQLVGADGVSYTSQYEAGTEATEYLVDGLGRTLYTFVNDFAGVNNFTAADFSNDGVWPVYETNLDEIPSTYSLSDFGTIDVFGKQQLTYKGWPLYYFGQDNATRGNNGGISFPAPGVWPIANSTIESAPAAPPSENTFDIFSGATMTFNKGDGADPTSESNQDRITDNVWITRGNDGGQIFNAAVEDSSSKTESPTGTEWAIGTTDNVEQLTFAPFRTTIRPKNVVGENLVLHLMADDVYIDIKFTSWSEGKTGGFTYERATR